MGLVKLKISGTGGVARNGKYSVQLNDHEITDGLTAVTLEMGVGEVNRAHLEVLVDRLEVDAETKALLTVVEPTDERTSFVSRFREWIR